MDGEKKKPLLSKILGGIQQMATRRYYTYVLFSSISQLENGAH